MDGRREQCCPENLRSILGRKLGIQSSANVILGVSLAWEANNMPKKENRKFMNVFKTLWFASDIDSSS